MTDLFIFIFGVIAVSCALPILQTLSDLICTAIDSVKNKLNVSIAKSTVEIAKLSIDDKHTNAIGFSLDSDSDDDFCDPEDRRGGGKNR